jgi:hypothetical protein
MGPSGSGPTIMLPHAPMAPFGPGKAITLRTSLDSRGSPRIVVEPAKVLDDRSPASGVGEETPPNRLDSHRARHGGGGGGGTGSGSGNHHRLPSSAAGMPVVSPVTLHFPTAPSSEPHVVSGVASARTSHEDLRSLLRQSGGGGSGGVGGPSAPGPPFISTGPRVPILSLSSVSAPVGMLPEVRGAHTASQGPSALVSLCGTSLM